MNGLAFGIRLPQLTEETLNALFGGLTKVPLLLVAIARARTSALVFTAATSGAVRVSSAGLHALVLESAPLIQAAPRATLCTTLAILIICLKSFWSWRTIITKFGSGGLGLYVGGSGRFTHLHT